LQIDPPLSGRTVCKWMPVSHGFTAPHRQLFWRLPPGGDSVSIPIFLREESA
jgi:hypothetical protein